MAELCYAASVTTALILLAFFFVCWLWGQAGHGKPTCFDDGIYVRGNPDQTEANLKAALRAWKRRKPFVAPYPPAPVTRVPAEWQPADPNASAPERRLVRSHPMRAPTWENVE